jgi:hypothetical protein
LLYWNSKGLARSLRIFLAAYLALTVASTLGTGEHYFVDLVAGVPFALFVQGVVSPGRKTALSRRAIAAGSGLGLTLGWLLLVRFAAKTMLVSPILPWTLAIGTIAGVWAINSWFASATTSPQSDHVAPPQTLALGAHG